jgi:carbonic anhydrase
VRLGNLTALINKIEPAVDAVLEPNDETLRNSKNIDFVNNVAEMNVQMSIENIRNQSPVLAEMEANNEIKIVGGMYDISNGKVSFSD